MMQLKQYRDPWLAEQFSKFIVSIRESSTASITFQALQLTARDTDIPLWNMHIKASNSKRHVLS